MRLPQESGIVQSRDCVAEDNCHSAGNGMANGAGHKFFPVFPEHGSKFDELAFPGFQHNADFRLPIIVFVV